MSLESVIKTHIQPNVLTHIELRRPDGRMVQLVAEVEHGRLFLMRYAPAYSGAVVQVWSVYRWRGDEGEWVANRVPGEARFDAIQAATEVDPVVIELER